MNNLTLSKIKKKHIFIWLIFIILCVAVAVYYEILHNGLRGTIYYRSLGYAVYPIFYGACTIALIKLIKLFNDNKYIYISDGRELHVGGYYVELQKINKVYEQRDILFKKLYFETIDKQTISTNVYLLDRSSNEIIEDMRKYVTLE